MPAFTPDERTPDLRKRTFGAILITLPMMVFSYIMLLGGMSFSRADPLRIVAFFLTFLLVSFLFFMMNFTGKTDPYRAILFILFALTTVITFLTIMFETRGGMALRQEDMIKGESPFCYMVIPTIIIPAVLTGNIIFPGSILQGFASVSVMLVIWFGGSLVLGKGWCSWGCFYGGFEDGFSRLLKKPRFHPNPKWRYFPYALLLFVVLTSAVTLSSTYCGWLCPFKTVTEFEEIRNWQTLVATIIFVTLFISLVVVLPLLTKRRTQCSFFCPFGAFQAFTDSFSPFEVRIDREKCVSCGLCVSLCPTYSMDEETLQKGKPYSSCSKCGKCIDHCPEKAVFYHIKGTPSHRDGRLFYLYPAFLFLVTFGGGILQSGLYRILLLMTTGKLLLS